MRHAPRLRLALATWALVTPATSLAEPPPPRSVRVMERMVERASARQAIAEARAARAEARLADIAPLAASPQAPRPATLRRMARTGVPAAVRSPVATAARTPATTNDASRQSDAPTRAPAPITAAPPAVAHAEPAPSDSIGVVDDGTRSVLTTAEQPEASDTGREPSGPAVTHPPMELLPTP